MKNSEDEEMVRIILFRKDFSESLKYFELSRSANDKNDKFIRDALIKMGIISYAKPFMKNTGVHNEVKSYRLPSSIVPEDRKWLHEMFLNYRGNFIAHSNFKTMKPDVGGPEETPKGKMIPIQYIDISFDHWFEYDEEYPEEPLLIDQVSELISELTQQMPRLLTNEEVLASD